MTYRIDYKTGAGDETITGTLDEAKAAADAGAAYTQQPVVIRDAEDGEEICRRPWWGVEFDADLGEDDADIISFGGNGYYGPWTED